MEPEKAPEQPEDLTNELTHQPYEPLLPIEKKLIGISLTLGIVLLGVLMWISSVWFALPVGK